MAETEIDYMIEQLVETKVSVVHILIPCIHNSVFE